MRREFPDLVTLEPADDDEDVFGDVWPLIVEWRELKATHPNEGQRTGLAAHRRTATGTGADAVGRGMR